MSRGVPIAFVMVPTPAWPIVAAGRSNCGWLSILNNSPRSCKWNRSVRAKSLNKEVSRLKRLGPRRMFLPASPKVYRAGVAHTAPGTPKEVLNQSLMVGFGTVGLTPDTMLGRLPEPVLATAFASVGVKGSPVCAVRIMFTCQPPNALFVHDLPRSNRFPFPNGRS